MPFGEGANDRQELLLVGWIVKLGIFKLCGVEGDRSSGFPCQSITKYSASSPIAPVTGDKILVQPHVIVVDGGETV